MLVDDNATGCSGASASVGTLVTTNHLLLLPCWQCAKRPAIRTQKERKYQNLPMHLMFGSFDGREHLDMWQKKNHISFQQTCSVLKLSTVALPVRSSETWSPTRRSNFGIVFSGELNLSERLTKGSCTIYSPKKLISTQMRPTISLLNFQIYWMTVLYPGRVISGFTFGVRYKYYSCSKAYKVIIED